MESKFDATIADLEEDIAIFDEVKAKADKVSELVYMQQRHVLQKNSNHQFVEAVKPEHKKDPDWKASLNVLQGAAAVWRAPRWSWRR